MLIHVIECSSNHNDGSVMCVGMHRSGVNSCIPAAMTASPILHPALLQSRCRLNLFCCGQTIYSDLLCAGRLVRVVAL